MRRLLGAGMLIGVGAAGYMLALRPRTLKWGATEAELTGPVPGDGMVARPRIRATHAITINAPAEKVWPWLAQIGCGRGGWYSYDRLDNGGVPSADRILPEYQELKVGDIVPATPDGKFGFPIAAIEPGRSFTLGGTMDPRTLQDVDPADPAVKSYFNARWTFFANGPGESTTRLITRFEVDWKPVGKNSYFYALELINFIMGRKMLLNIKKRVES